MDSKDNSVDGSPRSSSFKDPARARKTYQRLQTGQCSVLRRRKFVFGAMYNQLFNGYYEIDPMKNDFDIEVTLPTNQVSVVSVRLVTPLEGRGPNYLLTSILDLGKQLNGPGNARGSTVGDIGSMHALGLRSLRTKECYKGTAENANKIKVVSSLMRNWMEENMRTTLKDLHPQTGIHDIDGLLSCMPNGPGTRMMFSINLGNAAHYDVNDDSESVAVWVELKPGQAKNWYFILPNVSYKGSSGLVVKLHHGVAISWDGRKIYHCTSKTQPGLENKVFGCMWGKGK